MLFMKGHNSVKEEILCLFSINVGENGLNRSQAVVT